MADVFSHDKRSWLMGRVHGRNTRPEIATRSFLRSHGLKLRMHVEKLPGTPDIVLHDLKKAIFINGCFWHQHPGCCRATMPKSNRQFWRAKLMRNVKRDKEVKKLLHKQGWSVITLWECRLKNAKNRDSCLENLLRRLEQR
jgi:DNA mismatch endonuclease (patch repair protein)